MSIMSGNICLHKWPLFFTNKNDNINETQRDIPTSNHRILRVTYAMQIFIVLSSECTIL